jgi:hypothetical protein
MMQMMMSMFGQRGGQAGCGCNNPMALRAGGTDADEWLADRHAWTGLSKF